MSGLQELKRIPGVNPKIRETVPHQGQGLVDLTTGVPGRVLAAGVGIQTVPFFVNLADIATGEVLTDYIPGFRFALLSLDFRTAKAVTTGSKAATISLEIDTTAVTGGSLVLTSATATPAGKDIAGTAITGANVGGASQSFSLLAASVTTFVEGSGWVLVKLQNLDTADAIASLASLFGT